MRAGALSVFFTSATLASKTIYHKLGAQDIPVI